MNEMNHPCCHEPVNSTLVLTKADTGNVFMVSDPMIRVLCVYVHAC